MHGYCPLAIGRIVPLKVHCLFLAEGFLLPRSPVGVPSSVHPTVSHKDQDRVTAGPYWATRRTTMIS